MFGRKWDEIKYEKNQFKYKFSPKKEEKELNIATGKITRESFSDFKGTWQMDGNTLIFTPKDYNSLTLKQIKTLFKEMTK